jgi:hypothetical protein
MTLLQEFVVDSTKASERFCATTDVTVRISLEPKVETLLQFSQPRITTILFLMMMMFLQFPYHMTQFCAIVWLNALRLWPGPLDDILHSTVRPTWARCVKY